MIESDEFDNLFQRMMRPFRELDDVWNELKILQTCRRLVRTTMVTL